MKSHLDEILEQIDEQYSEGNRGHAARKIIYDDNGNYLTSRYVTIIDIKSTLRTSLSSLMEKYGEEIIGKNEVKKIPKNFDEFKIGMNKYVRTGLRIEQRTKLKEIIKNLK